MRFLVAINLSIYRAIEQLTPFAVETLDAPGGGKAAIGINESPNLALLRAYQHVLKQTTVILDS
jgi:hypothetical protein